LYKCQLECHRPNKYLVRSRHKMENKLCVLVPFDTKTKR
jgi:hypothetical protein